jgi:hypothetical protein
LSVKRPHRQLQPQRSGAENHWAIMHILLALLLTTACLCAHAQGQGPAARLPHCEPAVRFSAAWFASPEVDNGKTAAELTKLGAGGIAGGTAMQLGHVVVETKLSVAPQSKCLGVVIRLEYIKPVLRVASEIAPGGCAYAHVMNHELTHVRLHRDIAQQFRELAYPWGTGAPSPASDTSHTSGDLLRYARQELDRLMRAQALFDSPEEYARNRTVCGGEITRLVKAAG